MAPCIFLNCFGTFCLLYTTTYHNGGGHFFLSTHCTIYNYCIFWSKYSTRVHNERLEQNKLILRQNKFTFSLIRTIFVKKFPNRPECKCSRLVNINKKSTDYKERKVDRTSLSAGNVPVILFVKKFPNRPECKCSCLVNINKE